MFWLLNDLNVPMLAACSLIFRLSCSRKTLGPWKILSVPRNSFQYLLIPLLPLQDSIYTGIGMPILISVKLAKQQKWCTARMLMTSSVGNLLPIFASCLFIKTFGISHSPILNSGQRIWSKHNSNSRIISEAQRGSYIYCKRRTKESLPKHSWTL